ncbi:MAG: integrase [Candidatus Cloacimonadota bacterium]|nr:integrase [Candidatus Cloacimonadota bacterium]
MAIIDKMKKLEGVRGIFFKDDEGKFKDDLCERDYRKVQGPFQLVIRMKIDGKRHHFTKSYNGITLKRAIDEAKAERLYIQANYDEVTKKKMTFEKLLNEFLEAKKSSMSDHHIQNYRLTLSKHLPHIAKKDITKITTKNLQIAADKILANDGAPRTAKAIQDYTRPVFNYAIEKKYTKENPAQSISIPKYDNRRYFEIDDKSAKVLYQKIVNYHDDLYRAVLIFLLHGRRLNEVLSIEWQNIHMDKGYYEIVSHNNKARRNMVYPITELLMSALETQPVRKNGLVFISKLHHEKINNEVIRKHWKKIVKELGREEMRLHDLRHLLGFLMVNDGVPLEAIGKTLGHTSSEVTQRYANTSYKTVESVTEQFLKKLSE